MKAQFGTYGSLTTAALVSSMRGWEASKHPRHPAGAPASQGGEFAPASYGNSSDPGLNNVLAIARKSAYAKLASGKILRREALNAYMIERVKIGRKSGFSAFE